MKRITIASAATVSICFPVLSLASVDLEGQLLQCRNLADSLERLVCFDRIALVLSQAQQTPSVSEHLASKNSGVPAISAREVKVIESADTVVADAPAVDQSLSNSEVAPASASRNEPWSDVKDRPEIIESVISGTSRRPRGELTITLENGQVWTQTSSKKRRLEAGDSIQIKPGLFGGFQLFPEHGRPMRVRRIR